jgi:hypothetical protein
LGYTTTNVSCASLLFNSTCIRGLIIVAKPMEKKTNKYLLTLQSQQYANGDVEPKKHLELKFDNHDEVFSIIEKIKEKDPFSDQEQATEFALGLKLFSEVMIKNRNHPLFEELTPAFGSFMKRLKSL